MLMLTWPSVVISLIVIIDSFLEFLITFSPVAGNKDIRMKVYSFLCLIQVLVAGIKTICYSWMYTVLKGSIISLLATIREFQLSGWLHVWQYILCKCLEVLMKNHLVSLRHALRVDAHLSFNNIVSHWGNGVLSKHGCWNDHVIMFLISVWATDEIMWCELSESWLPIVCGYVTECAGSDCSFQTF
jgi:hypothetical protein